ncbi:MAG: PEP-CTERM sorting domain-containing protein [Patescibacteria group bacterium]|nr:PEP-CTERM sorting domain-containing protein [Patescibacteria group bacterium]
MKKVFSLVVLAFLSTLMVASTTSAGRESNLFKLSPLTAPTGLDYMSSSYANSRWLATKSGVIGEVAYDGSWNTYGIKGRNPYYAGGKVAFYDEQGFASIWNGSSITHVTEAAQFINPLIRPTGNSAGDVLFGNMQVSFLLRANHDGTTEGYIPFAGVSGPWWITGATFGPNNNIFVVGQNTRDYLNQGYHVYSGTGNGNWKDTNFAFSEIAYGGGWMWGVAFDGITAYASKVSNGKLDTPYVIGHGGDWDLIGADGSGAIFQQGDLYWKASPVPEPGSLLALASGLVGLIGFGLRRRQ